MAEISVDVRNHVCKVLEEAEPDVLRNLLSNMIHLLMNAEADTMCGAEYVSVGSGFQDGKMKEETSRRDLSLRCGIAS